MLRNMNWFIDYWDDVICQWFSGNIESKQQLFLNETSLKLNPEHMPEPYWGDPENCSIVIANYNPGGGADRNRHTWRECAYCPESFINQVKQNGYSNVVRGFPIIDNPNAIYDPLNNGVCWWQEYGGRGWWLKKMKWLDENILKLYPQDNLKKKPFAIEFCAWHSVNWPSNACQSLYHKNKRVGPFINRLFIKALVDAVHNSETKLGVCVGSQFYHLFDAMLKCSICVQHVSSQKTTNSKINLHLFRIDGANILVLWGKGRNRYPNGMQKEISTFFN